MAFCDLGTFRTKLFNLTSLSNEKLDEQVRLA